VTTGPATAVAPETHRGLQSGQRHQLSAIATIPERTLNPRRQP